MCVSVCVCVCVCACACVCMRACVPERKRERGGESAMHVLDGKISKLFVQQIYSLHLVCAE